VGVPGSPSLVLHLPVCSWNPRSCRDLEASPVSVDALDSAVAPLLVDFACSTPPSASVRRDTGNTFCRLGQVPVEAAVPHVDFARCDRRDTDSSGFSFRYFP